MWVEVFGHGWGRMSWSPFYVLLLVECRRGLKIGFPAWVERIHNAMPGTENVNRVFALAENAGSNVDG